MSVHLYVGRWSWLDAVDDNFLLLSELICMPYSAAVSMQIDVIGKPLVAKRSSSNGHWTRQRGVSLFCFSAASSAKQSFTDERTGVTAFYIIFSGNILNLRIKDGFADLLSIHNNNVCVSFPSGVFV